MEIIIDEHGKTLRAWFRKDGNLIHDYDTKYGCDFAIGVYYNETQAQQYAEIKTLKKYLKDTDHKAIKYSEGAYTEEEYAPFKERRAQARARINEIEKDFKEPTLTKEQIEEAERKAMEKEEADDNADDQS